MERRNWVESRDDCGITVSKQCDLLALSRSGYYYKPVPETEYNLELMRLIDEIYLDKPFFGRPRFTHALRKMGHEVNEKRVGRLMQKMGIKALVPGPHTSLGRKEHKKYPYLLKELEIGRCNQVWAADITYIPVAGGYLYLMAIIDWFSRYIVSWQLSNTLESDFCVLALENALAGSRPEIFNTDQGVQFTSESFTSTLNAQGIRISMDGRGHYWDNIIVERLWRTVKYEEVYLKRYENSTEAQEGLSWYIDYYNGERPHQSLAYQTPAEVYKKFSPEKGKFEVTI